MDMMMHVRQNDIVNDMMMVLNTPIYKCCISLTWPKRNGNWLAVQVLAYWFICYMIYVKGTKCYTRLTCMSHL